MPYIQTKELADELAVSVDDPLPVVIAKIEGLPAEKYSLDAIEALWAFNESFEAANQHVAKLSDWLNCVQTIVGYIRRIRPEIDALRDWKK